MAEPAPDEVAPGVFVFTSSLYRTTTTVVAGESGGCLVIDPAVTVPDLSAIADWLTARGLRARVGWSTHPHWDHVLWTARLGTGVPRYATPAATAAAAARREDLEREAGAEAPGHDRALIADLVALDSGVIPWDGPAARVIAHDGHAPGHGAVFLPEPGVLVAGDMCSDAEIPLLDTESADPFGAYRVGLRRLASLRGVRIVVPGHGRPGDNAAFRSRLAADVAYLDAVEAGRNPGDPRLASAEGWLLAEHERQVALASE
jgi:glyoxylase-like metal-dependent hydrolase (beta-lactamase superfamily II)